MGYTAFMLLSCICLKSARVSSSHRPRCDVFVCRIVLFWVFLSLFPPKSDWGISWFCLSLCFHLCAAFSCLRQTYPNYASSKIVNKWLCRLIDTKEYTFLPHYRHLPTLLDFIAHHTPDRLGFLLENKLSLLWLVGSYFLRVSANFITPENCARRRLCHSNSMHCPLNKIA